VPVRVHFSLDMRDLNPDQEDAGERVGAVMGLGHADWDVTWTPGMVWHEDEFHASFHIVGTITANATVEELAQALMNATYPAFEQVRHEYEGRGQHMPDLPYQVKVWLAAA